MASPEISCPEIDNTFQLYAEHCRDGFDFTLIFEQTIFGLLPLGLLLLISPFRILHLLPQCKKVYQSLLLSFKIATLSCLGATQMLLLALWTFQFSDPTRVSIAYSTLAVAATFALCLLSYFEHTRTIRPSFLLESYLFFTLLLDLAQTRTLWMRQTNDTGHKLAIAFTVGVALKFVALLLEAAQKRDNLYPEYKDYPSEATAGAFSRSFFGWLNPLFITGFSKVLKVDDLYLLDTSLESDDIHQRMETAWEKVGTKGPNSLLFTAFKTLKWPIISIIPPRAALIALTFCQPLLISKAVILSVDSVNTWTNHEGYGLIGAFILVYVGVAVCMGLYQHLTYRAITMARGGLISMLSRKATELSICDIDPAASLTLMSADIERIVQGWQTAHEIWANTCEIATGIVLLEGQLGVACVVPIAVSVVSLIAAIAALTFVVSRQTLWLEAIERRISSTSSMIGAMKGIKMTGLRDILLLGIHKLRVDELTISKKFRRLLILNMGIGYVTQIFAPVITFAVFVAISHSKGDMLALDIARIYTSLSIFALMTEPLGSLVMSLSAFVASIGCFGRIQTFLDKDVLVDQRQRVFVELPEGSTTSNRTSQTSEKDGFQPSQRLKLPMTKTQSPEGSDCAVIIENASFSWDPEQSAVLRNISFLIPENKFTMVIGPVGCGKSTLLKGILGEVPCTTGSIQISSERFAYCDQTIWHVNETVRNSIVASGQYDEQWYQTVVQACALVQDLGELRHGDQTMIGSKGVALSTGQSQRVALARAVYARRDIIVLDDPFSGLDTSTENHIFHHLIGKDGIFRRLKSTIIITSSSVKRLPYTDHIIALGPEGTIVEQGRFDDLNSIGGYVSRFNLSAPDWNYAAEEDSSSDSLSFSKEATSAIDVLESEENLEAAANKQTSDFSIYKYYMKSVGWMAVFIFVFFISAFIFGISFPSIWVKWWAAADFQQPYIHNGYYLGIYAMIDVLALLSLVISCWQLVITMVPKSGEAFHWTLLKTVLNAPMSFFSNTDSGVTINRFSQDLQLIDMELPVAFLNTFATLMLCIAQTTLIGVASKYTAIAFPIVIIALWFIQKYYLRTSRQLRFMDLEAKAPLYSQFTECLSGLATIRAFGWQKAVQERGHKLLDRSQRPFYLLYAVQRWLTLVLDLLVAAIATILIILVVELRGSDTLAGAYVGVALLNLIQFSQSIKLLVTFWTTLETHIGAIARIKIFNETIKSENLPDENQPLPPSWPSEGAIEFKSISAAYRDAELVLKDISLSIKSGEKVGICGRTGSGKSSLTLALFRMVELSSGSITVDGVDLATLPREEIRRRITGVSQDPFLIRGTVRLNADISGDCSDDAILTALKSVQLADIIQTKGGLDAPVEDLHLSHGQKQLFCLARAMLRRSTILVLDEATSNVDSKTDEVMQRVLREKFANHTVLAVAHKLDTILDFDKVAMLEAGQLIEFGDPYTLLSTDSAFNKLYTCTVTEDDEVDDDQDVI